MSKHPDLRKLKRQPKRAVELLPPDAEHRIDRCPVCRDLLYSTDQGKYCGKCGWSNIRGQG